MNRMLELYKYRFGNAVKKQGDGYNGPCPLCGGEPGKSDRFMIWDWKHENLSKICTENHIHGVYNCRQCRATGDTMSYLLNIEGMTFKEALDELGIQPYKAKVKKSKKTPKLCETKKFSPVSREVPGTKWQDFVLKLQEKTVQDIWQSKEARKYLNERGICDEAIQEYKLGYLVGENRKSGIFRMRSALGLDPKEKDGVNTNRIFIPRGITIPTYWENELISLRIRRPKVDTLPTPTGYIPPKYMELKGSSRMPFILLPESQTVLNFYVVVEAELDAILIHYAMKKQVGVIALRSNQNKPCSITHELIKDSPRILFAMDYEESNAGIAGIDFWKETYPQLKRWPTPEGKDPGEAYKLGIDIALWIKAGLPESFQFVKSSVPHRGIITEKTKSYNENQETGHLDKSFTGNNTLRGAGEILLFLYNNWGLPSFKYLYAGKGIIAQNTTCNFRNESLYKELQNEKIALFHANSNVMKWWGNYKHRWIYFSDIEKGLKEVGIL